jgi:hypothetical protein
VGLELFRKLVSIRSIAHRRAQPQVQTATAAARHCGAGWECDRHCVLPQRLNSYRALPAFKIG